MLLEFRGNFFKVLNGKTNGLYVCVGVYLQTRSYICFLQSNMTLVKSALFLYLSLLLGLSVQH